MDWNESVKEFESMLKGIEKYETPIKSSIEKFLKDYGISFEPSDLPRPEVKGISGSEVFREIREARF